MIALKRELREYIKVTHDSGPPLRESLSMKIPVSECVSEEEDVSPDTLKRDASKDVWEEERELPTLSPAEKVKPRARLKAGFIIK